MKKFLLFGLALGLYNTVLHAQKVHFIYLQSETAAPFYLKMNGKVYSSSSQGYLILPSLTDSTYAFHIGRPGGQSEPKFAVTINHADRGFLLKNVDGELNLFDLQSLSLSKPVQEQAGAYQIIQKNDRFSQLLASAAGDPSLLQEVVAIAPEKGSLKEKAEAVAKEQAKPKQEQSGKASITPPASKEPAPVAAKEPAAKEVTAPAPVPVAEPEAAKPEPSKPEPVKTEAQKEAGGPHAPATSIAAVVLEAPKEAPRAAKAPREEPQEVFVKSVVTRRSESSQSGGFGLVFLDTYKGSTDTIRLFIPNQKEAFRPAKTAAQEVKAPESQVAPVAKTEEPATAAALASHPPAGCPTQASEKEFFRLRRNMASKEGEEQMIVEAKKAFKSRCFTTEQVKNLSALFLTPAGKYNFFDAAYLHVADREKFSSLEGEISDQYFANRFKALIAQ
ncbi:hypothetical protein V9K67_16805 [Paraflavisolibacter sp. H34]|uniref:hypothetical protein n=1 Tax=Huijunlia imazamoxiresistens TaxID=3127457 RepID=UPI0030170CC5